jgi:hypothetical protein
MPDQFRPGQIVRLSRGSLSRLAAEGDYKIVKVLPRDSNETQYRIKNVREPFERVVAESAILKT